MEKSEGVKKAIEDAQATLEKLGKDDESKKERLEELEGEKEEVEGMVKALQGQLDVRYTSLSFLFFSSRL